MPPAAPSQTSSVSERLPKPTKNEHRNTGVEPISETTRTDIPVVKGLKGLCYDVRNVADEARRKRILANRASAKSSRQRRLDEARTVHDDLARLEDENSALREANIALQRRITEAHAAIDRFHSFGGNANASCDALNTITTCTGELSMHTRRAHPLPPFWTAFTRAPPELALSSILPPPTLHISSSRWGN
mmetsp:Transcript_3000/g.6514  ORF Transcript_3000/g.6514 Transcript_3000/m.6514 type:complete len:190 (+) Transcript_3000:33-602(+)